MQDEFAFENLIDEIWIESDSGEQVDWREEASMANAVMLPEEITLNLKFFQAQGVIPDPIRFLITTYVYANRGEPIPLSEPVDARIFDQALWRARYQAHQSRRMMN